MKKFKVAYYMAFVFIAGIVALYFLSSGRSFSTQPVLTLGYHENYAAAANAVAESLGLDSGRGRHVWLGVEPQRRDHLLFARELRRRIENRNGAFDKVFLEGELQLSVEEQALFGNAEIRYAKNNWGAFAKELNSLGDLKILVLTASIYATNILKANPLEKISAVTTNRPLTIAMGYFPTTIPEEKNNLFPCLTEDREGIVDWGCAVINKARSQRRKLDLKKIALVPMPVMVTVDRTGDGAFMMLMR